MVCEQDKLIVQKSLGLCMNCNAKRLRKKSENKKKERIKDGKDLDPNKLDIFYQQYWNKHPDRTCIECEITLKTYHKWHIHHLIPKKLWNKYTKDIVYADDNCVYVCLECHSQAETRLDLTNTIKYLTISKMLEYDPYLKINKY